MSDLSARGVYGIAVAAELAGVGQQTLRLYEKKGLVSPHRTSGGTRRYSDDDVALVRRIATMLVEGLNLMGARRVLELEAINDDLRERLERRGQFGQGRQSRKEELAR